MCIRDSSSSATTTPTDGDRLLTGSAGSNGGVTLVTTVVRPRPEVIGGGGCPGDVSVRPEAGVIENGDPRLHVYSTVEESLRLDGRLPSATSLITRDGLQTDQSLQLYQQQDHEVNVGIR